jgi:predicted nucleotide-binding protein
MSNEELLLEYREDVAQLKLNDTDHLDKVTRKGKMLIRNIYGSDSQYLKEFQRISFYLGYAPASEEAKIKRWQQGQQQIINHINTLLEELSLFGTGKNISEKIENTTIQNNNRVFIVHGHDDAAKVNIARYLEKLGLEAIILHEQASKGKTIIEKFEEHAAGSCFAVVLLTPDDVGYPQNKEVQAKPRARQNVIFELGYFCGAISRKNVCVLFKEGVEIPNDYLGVVYTPMDDSGAWQLHLAKEMKHAGLQFDMNNAFS